MAWGIEEEIRDGRIEIVDDGDWRSWNFGRNVMKGGLMLGEDWEGFKRRNLKLIDMRMELKGRFWGIECGVLRGVRMDVMDFGLDDWVYGGYLILRLLVMFIEVFWILVRVGWIEFEWKSD